MESKDGKRNGGLQAVQGFLYPSLRLVPEGPELGPARADVGHREGADELPRVAPSAMGHRVAAEEPRLPFVQVVKHAYWNELVQVRSVARRRDSPQPRPFADGTELPVGGRAGDSGELRLCFGGDAEARLGREVVEVLPYERNQQLAALEVERLPDFFKRADDVLAVPRLACAPFSWLLLF